MLMCSLCVSFGLHQEEQEQYLDMLRKWSAPESRTLLVLGGDLHIGMSTNVKYKDQIVFRQMITTAISNKPPPCPVYWWMRMFMSGCCSSIAFNYKAEHSGFLNERNFGYIEMRAPADGKPDIKEVFVTASE